MSDTEVQNEVENTPVITAKDPKRVEQGKRLAAISKEAKEKKMRARIKEEDFSYLPWIGYCVAGFSSMGMLYLLWAGREKEEPELEKVTIEKPLSPVKKRKKFEEF